MDGVGRDAVAHLGVHGVRGQQRPRDHHERRSQLISRGHHYVVYKRDHTYTTSSFYKSWPTFRQTNRPPPIRGDPFITFAPRGRVREVANYANDITDRLRENANEGGEEI